MKEIVKISYNNGRSMSEYSISKVVKLLNDEVNKYINHFGGQNKVFKLFINNKYINTIKYE